MMSRLRGSRTAGVHHLPDPPLVRRWTPPRRDRRRRHPGPLWTLAARDDHDPRLLSCGYPRLRPRHLRDFLRSRRIGRRDRAAFGMRIPAARAATRNSLRSRSNSSCIAATISARPARRRRGAEGGDGEAGTGRHQRGRGAWCAGTQNAEPAYRRPVDAARRVLAFAARLGGRRDGLRVRFDDGSELELTEVASHVGGGHHVRLAGPEEFAARDAETHSEGR